MPVISANRAPTDARAAPTRTTGSTDPRSAADNTDTNGDVDEASTSEPPATNAATPTTTYTATVIPNASGIARGMVRAGSRTSSPIVAMRA
jgi:hypothetical protein